MMGLVICLSLSPVTAGEDTYSINIGGINFNIPNNYQVNEDFIFEDDVNVIDRWYNNVPAHYKSVDFSDGKNTITISVTTSNGEPFTNQNVGFADNIKTKIANKTGSLNKSPGDVLFSYVEDGKVVAIETLMEKDNENIIEKCIGT